MRPRSRRKNRGSFAPGPDPRRHVFSTEERAEGYAAAKQRLLQKPGLEGWNAYAWLWRKVRGYYRAERKSGQ